MGEKSKLRKVFWGILCVLCVCTPLVVMADENNRRDYVKSKGKIDFDNGTVVLDSTDLLYLADQVDELESIYKVTVIDALNKIGTYFRNDGSVTTKEERNEVDTKGEKESLSMGSVKEGVLQSQSVSSLF